MSISIGPWDVLLVLLVSTQATILAYLKPPKWKAFVFSLPIPFTFSTLAVGRPVGASNVLGLVVLFCYAQGVRLLYQRAHVPIVLAILLAALGYCAAGALMAPIVPGTDLAFWLAVAGVFALGAALYLALPRRNEPEYRSPLPVWVKLPIIAAVILILVTIKNTLQGFMTLFPFVGVIAAYEARHSLWTIGRQIPAMMMLLTPLMVVSHVAQPRVGLGPSLALGWLVFLALFLTFTKVTWAREAQGLQEESDG